MPNLSPQQRAYIRRRTRVHEPDPSELSSELNIIPFLDIVVNLIMFLLATSEGDYTLSLVQPVHILMGGQSMRFMVFVFLLLSLTSHPIFRCS